MKKLITTVLLLLCFLATISPGYASKQFGHRFGPRTNPLASAAPELGIFAAYYQTASASNYYHPTGQPGYWLDSSGNNRTFTAPSDGESPEVGTATKGVCFDRSLGDRLTSGDNFHVGSFSARPCSVVFKVQKLAEAAVGTHGYLSGQNPIIWLYNNGGLSAPIINDGVQKSDGYCITDGSSFYTLVFVFNGANSTIWCNGIKQATGDAGTGPLSSSTLHMVIGDAVPHTAGINSLYGKIQAALFYSRALSDAECAASPNWF